MCGGSTAYGYQHQDGRNRIAGGNGRDGAGADEITEQRGTGDAADRGPDEAFGGSRFGCIFASSSTSAPEHHRTTKLTMARRRLYEECRGRRISEKINQIYRLSPFFRFELLVLAAMCPISVGSLSLIFVDADCLAGHVAWNFPGSFSPGCF